MGDDTVTKKEFAALLGVTPGRVSQWLASKQLSGAAIVGSGHRARIRATTAREQLARTLDVDQRLSGNGKAKLDNRQRPSGATKAGSSSDPSPGPCGAISEPPQPHGDADDDYRGPVEEKIKQARLEQISLANEKARAEASVRTGRHVRADDARQQMGRIAGRMITVFDAAIIEFANTLAAQPPTSQRETLRILRSTWREIRARQSKTAGAEAALMPALLEDEVEEKNVSRC